MDVWTPNSPGEAPVGLFPFRAWWRLGACRSPHAGARAVGGALLNALLASSLQFPLQGNFAEYITFPLMFL
jgi:hypothetical protein